MRQKLDSCIALLTALRILGYTPYHGSELFQPQNAKDYHNKCWADGLIGRREGGVRYGVAEFDKLLGRYDVSLAFSQVESTVYLHRPRPMAKVLSMSRSLPKRIPKPRLS